jgi:transcriptional regulator of NAD metabolism
MKTTIITASIHVSPESDVSVFVDKLESDDSKYAVLLIGDASIFIRSREKALEISRLLKKAAKKWDEEE